MEYNYTIELARKLSAAKRDLKKLEHKIQRLKVTDPIFMETYRESNEIRIKIETIRSRIKNRYNTDVVMDHPVIIK